MESSPAGQPPAGEATAPDGREAAAAATRLRAFGSRINLISPLYALLAQTAADAPEIAALAGAAPDDDGQAMLLLAAVHYRLQTSDNALRDYYPTLGGSRQPDHLTANVFRQFVLEHYDELHATVTSAVVQTNEVQRAAVLYPAVAHVAAHASGAIALIEIGCSAGLLLGMDQYGYRFTHASGEHGVTIDGGDNALTLDCEISGSVMPLNGAGIDVCVRIGLDRRPVDCQDPDDIRWLEACVWADQPERLSQLRRAVAARARYEVEMVSGDALQDLAATLARVPPSVPTVVLTSWVLTYLSSADQVRLIAALDAAAQDRALWWIANEPFDACGRHLVASDARLDFEHTRRTLVSFTGWSTGVRQTTALGLADVHGTSLHGLPQSETKVQASTLR